MAIDYQQLLERSIKDLARALRERRDLEFRITRLQKMVLSLAARIGPSDLADGQFPLPSSRSPEGITEAVRWVLFTYRIWLTPTEIRDLLPTANFDVKRHKNPLTCIHSILRRLVASGIAIRSTHERNSAFRWADRQPTSLRRQINPGESLTYPREVLRCFD